MKRTEPVVVGHLHGLLPAGRPPVRTIRSARRPLNLGKWQKRFGTLSCRDAKTEVTFMERHLRMTTSVVVWRQQRVLIGLLIRI